MFAKLRTVIVKPFSFSGFDLDSDFDMLEASLPSFGKAIENRKNMMDIKILGNRVEAAFPDVFPFKEGS